MTFLDNEYREIITKAVCGKGRKYSKATHTISPTHRPSSILGCWVINHKYHAKKTSKDAVEIHGSYDINIWYSYHDNTKTEAMTERVTYSETIPLSVKDDHCISDDYDVVAKVTQQPNCLECTIRKKGHKIAVEVERGFVVKVIGETKVFVRVDPSRYTESEDDFDFEFTDKELSGVNPDFIRTKGKD
ncbi:MAG TPA: outer spore coat protein CotE [Virgibacillus sp.]|nr:outer spore coat protein CotE [Virgibacillus sp.]